MLNKIPNNCHECSHLRVELLGGIIWYSCEINTSVYEGDQCFPDHGIPEWCPVRKEEYDCSTLNNGKS